MSELIVAVLAAVAELTRLTQHRPALVTFPDEPMMAQIAEALWPSQPTHSIRRDIERERRRTRE